MDEGWVPACARKASLQGKQGHNSLQSGVMALKPSGIITLLTDFGLGDVHTGVMKGVILSIHPHVRLVDITHDVPPGAILQAALLLQEALPFFPEGTVHVAVVDPGVGGSRRAIAAEAGGRFLVGPDNGIFWPMISAATSTRIIHLTESRFFLGSISSTFHGRDIFAPVAAHLARGVDLSAMGSPVTDPVRLRIPEPRVEGNALIGEVLRVDRFGNLITTIPRDALEDFAGADLPVIRIGGLVIEGLARSYSDKREGESLALIGSSGRLEISVNRGRACDLTGAGSSGQGILGLEVRVSRPKAHL